MWWCGEECGEEISVATKSLDGSAVLESGLGSDVRNRSEAGERSTGFARHWHVHDGREWRALTHNRLNRRWRLVTGSERRVRAACTSAWAHRRDRHACHVLALRRECRNVTSSLGRWWVKPETESNHQSGCRKKYATKYNIELKSINDSNVLFKVFITFRKAEVIN